MKKLIAMRTLCGAIGFNLLSCASPSVVADTQEISCPATISNTYKLNEHQMLLGELSAKSLDLYLAGIVDGDILYFNSTESIYRDRSFSEDIIDEWDYLKNKTITTAEYENIMEKSLMCTYGSSPLDSNRNTAKILLTEFPKGSNAKCEFIRRDVKPLWSAKCIVTLPSTKTDAALKESAK